MNKSESKKHKLHYRMGNLGDVIKHGVLAEFVEWWGENETRPLICADTFAGCPYRESDSCEVEKGAVERLVALQGTAISRVYSHDKSRYLGSTELVRQISQGFVPKPSILVSDNASPARRELREAGFDVIDLPENNDGYTVLDDKVRRERAQAANLILIDPYDGFLLGESKKGNCRLQKAKALMEQNVTVALFVLDWWSKGGNNSKGVSKVHENYCQFKKSHLNGTAVSLRCFISQKHDAEILLMSQIFAKDGGVELHKRLKDFANAAQSVLPDGCEIEVWP